MAWVNRFHCCGCNYTVDLSTELESFTPQREEEAECRYCPNCWAAFAFPNRIEKRFMLEWLSKRKAWRQRSEFREFILSEIEKQMANVSLYSLAHFFLPTINCPACEHQLVNGLTAGNPLWCLRCEQPTLMFHSTVCHYQALVEEL